MLASTPNVSVAINNPLLKEVLSYTPAIGLKGT